MDAGSGTRTPLSITHHGHACVVVEGPAGTRILIDPGNLAGSLAGVRMPAAVFVTHGHEDHLDVSKLTTAFGTEPALYAPADTQEVLAQAGLGTTVIADAMSVSVGELVVEATAHPHEVMYPGIPLPENISLLIDHRVYHPGDSLESPTAPVDVLLLPLGAPWLKVSEIIDFTRAVSPRIVVPIHDGGLQPAHRALHTGLLRRFAPEGTTVLALVEGVATDV